MATTTSGCWIDKQIGYGNSAIRCGCGNSWYFTTVKAFVAGSSTHGTFQVDVQVDYHKWSRKIFISCRHCFRASIENYPESFFVDYTDSPTVRYDATYTTETPICNPEYNGWEQKQDAGILDKAGRGKKAINYYINKFRLKSSQ